MGIGYGVRRRVLPEIQTGRATQRVRGQPRHRSSEARPLPGLPRGIVLRLDPAVLLVSRVVP